LGKVLYKSTRSDGNSFEASEAILKGISEDGGLFVPVVFPKLGVSLEEIFKLNYKELALNILGTFFTDFSEEELKYCIDKAYNDKFDSELFAPLIKKGEDFFLELYHGPTLAFKDMALSILPYLIKVASKKNEINKDIVILTATSGDTGKAALEGFAKVPGTKIIVFYPSKGVSEIQKRQMVTQEGENTLVIGIDGSFDDAQSGVKNIFNDKKMLEKLDAKGYIFSSANSINIGRLIPQIVYYFYSYKQLLDMGEIELGEKINFTVPTGNFGNILAGFYAKKLGLPIDKFICASNVNNVLFDFINSGTYNKRRELIVTNSPSMDILLSSNLERFLYDISDSNSDILKGYMNSLADEGIYTVNASMLNKMKDFYGGFASEEETIEAIAKVYKSYNYVMDTHTAVAYKVYDSYRKKVSDTNKNVILSTASPFKFPSSVAKAIDNTIEGDDFQKVKELSLLLNLDIPRNIKDLDKKPIIHNKTCSRSQMSIFVEQFL